MRNSFQSSIQKGASAPFFPASGPSILLLNILKIRASGTVKFALGGVFSGIGVPGSVKIGTPRYGSEMAPLRTPFSAYPDGVFVPRQYCAFVIPKNWPVLASFVFQAVRIPGFAERFATGQFWAIPDVFRIGVGVGFGSVRFSYASRRSRFFGFWIELILENDLPPFLNSAGRRSRGYKTSWRLSFLRNSVCVVQDLGLLSFKSLTSSSILCPSGLHIFTPTIMKRLTLEEAVESSQRFFSGDAPATFNPSSVVLKVFSKYAETTPGLYRRALERELFRCIKAESRFVSIEDDDRFVSADGCRGLYLSDFTDGVEDDLKEIIVLLYRGYTIPEISAQLGVGRDTVSRRISLIRQILLPRFSSFL